MFLTIVNHYMMMSLSGSGCSSGWQRDPLLGLYIKRRVYENFNKSRDACGEPVYFVYACVYCLHSGATIRQGVQDDCASQFTGGTSHSCAESPYLIDSDGQDW